MIIEVDQLPASLDDVLARARTGGDVIVTDVGVPIARIVGIPSTEWTSDAEPLPVKVARRAPSELGVLDVLTEDRCDD
jgi:prevent-host-death family protein